MAWAWSSDGPLFEGGQSFFSAEPVVEQYEVPTIYIVSNPQEAREALDDDVFIVKPVSKVALRKAVAQVMWMVKAGAAVEDQEQPSA